MAHKRTTHRSGVGRKVYAIRDTKGRFQNIQTLERASRQDHWRMNRTEQRAKKR